MNSNDLGIMGTPNPNIELFTLPHNQGFLDHQRSHFHFPFSKYDTLNDTNYHLGSSSINDDSIAHYIIPTAEAPTMFSAGPAAGDNNGLHDDTVCFVNESSAHPFLASNQNNGRKKRKRNENGVGKNQRDVVHVRAKRGQATDSHSLAERLRREKINEKLRCLQDLIPGCYKTMGMAVMLDVITNYVRSLQNQIDFLSMKLSAASLFYDLNSDMDTVEQCRGKEIMYEAPVLDKEVVGGGGYAMQPQFYSSWPY